MTLSPRERALLSRLAIVALLGLAYVAQVAVNAARGTARLREIPYLPNKHLLRGLAADFDLLVADFLWIEATEIALPSESNPRRVDAAAWFYVLDTITEMDPYFAPVYRYGGTYLPKYVGDIARGNLLLEKGLRHLPDEWDLGVLLAFNHFYLSVPPDAEKASAYLDAAARSPAAPQYVREMAAMMPTKAGHRLKSMRMLMWLVDNSPSDYYRRSYRQEVVTLAGEMLDEAETVPAEAGTQATDLDAFLGELLRTAREVDDAGRRDLADEILRRLEERLRGGRLSGQRFRDLLRLRRQEWRDLSGG